MICSRLEACRLELVPHEVGVPLWRREAIASLADLDRILDAIPAEMSRYGYSETECFRVHLSLEEAIVNAHKHGNRRDWGKSITLRYHVSAEGVVAQVEDEGPGFNPESVPDPLAPENLMRTSGRGIFLIRSFMDDFQMRRLESGGTEVTLVKNLVSK